MKIISWNINGVRSAHKGGYVEKIFNLSPDILCLQEVKADPHQVPDEIREPLGYFSYFFPSSTKKGYSGVAVYTKIKPERTENGIGIKKFDEQGRMQTLFFKNFVLINVYIPNGGSKTADLNFKFEFFELFLKKVIELKKKYKNVIFCGDINVAHKEIDIARPKENQNHIGFLPEERAWVDKVIAHGYVDTFRYFNPNRANVYTYWDQITYARDRNVGWRIDYFFVNKEFIKNVKKSEILNNIYGSDHCPVLLEIQNP
ncbi:exodeoxyribonuclease III [Patescibacteria group bacterium]|nr:exodeoxyribonuclease III [Patescibacteria group bacterium]MBU4057457.1 exodeoxyribonuclease III [Patescibacteria group bacterium]MBU4115560.1 exodeoxyribonuclease III [Patescibacteria group bacterium]